MSHEYGMRISLNARPYQAVVFLFRFNGRHRARASWMFSKRLRVSRSGEPRYISMYRYIDAHTRVSDVIATMFDKVECIHLTEFNRARSHRHRTRPYTHTHTHARMCAWEFRLTAASSYHSYRVVLHAARTFVSDRSCDSLVRITRTQKYHLRFYPRDFRRLPVAHSRKNGLAAAARFVWMPEICRDRWMMGEYCDIVLYFWSMRTVETEFLPVGPIFRKMWHGLRFKTNYFLLKIENRRTGIFLNIAGIFLSWILRTTDDFLTDTRNSDAF